MNYYSQYNPSEEALQMAYNLMFTQSGEIPYLELSNFKEEEYRGFTLPAKDNPEENYSKKEIFQRLSGEAKEVVETILNAPSEIIELITTNKFGLYSKELIQKYFVGKGWKRRKVLKAFEELTAYTSCLD